MSKFFSSLLVLTFLVALVTYFFFLRITDNSLPDYDQNLISTRVNETILIHRDHNGIPFITSNNTSDLYFSIGFVHAQDRLFQMDLLRKMSEGRLSEWFGDTTLFTDIFYRNLLLKSQAEKILKQLSENERVILQSYVNGVNEFVQHSLRALPIQYSFLGSYSFEPWTELHSIMVYLMIKEAISPFQKAHRFNRDRMKKNYLLDYLDGLESRMVVVPETRSMTGKKITYIEKRSRPIIPGIDYSINLNTEYSENLTGTTISGIPILFSGVSKNRSWITQSEKNINPAKPNFTDLIVRHPEVISVKNAEDFNLILQTNMAETHVIGHDLLFSGEINDRIIETNYQWNQDFSSYHSLLKMELPIIPGSVNALLGDSVFYQGKFEKKAEKEIIHFPKSKLKFYQVLSDSSDRLWLDYIVRKKAFQPDEVSVLSEIDDYYYSVVVKLLLLNRLQNLTSDELKIAHKYLSVWRAEYNRQDIGSTLFLIWNYQFLMLTGENKLWVDPNFNFNDKYSIQAKTISLMQQSNKEIDSVIAVSMIKSVITLKHFFGDDPAGWRYENLMKFQLRTSTPTENQIIEENNNFEIRSEGYHFITAINYNKNKISVDQTIAVVRSFRESGSEAPNHYISIGGINEQIRSPFYSNQLRLWFLKKYIQLDGKQEFKYLTRIENEK